MSPGDDFPIDDPLDPNALALRMLKPARGAARVPREVAFDYVRELNLGDLDLLNNSTGKLPSTVPALKRLRHSHHMLARLLAEGTPDTEASYITGFATVTISNMKSDPSFQELIAHYADNVKEVYLDVHSRLARLGVDTIEELQDRLDAKPGQFTNNELLKMAELMLDLGSKGGQGAGSGSAPGLNINVHFTKPTEVKTEGVTIDVTPNPEDTPNGQA